MAYRAGLENRIPRKRDGGSNPSLSATTVRGRAGFNSRMIRFGPCAVAHFAFQPEGHGGAGAGSCARHAVVFCLSYAAAGKARPVTLLELKNT